MTTPRDPQAKPKQPRSKKGKPAAPFKPYNAGLFQLRRQRLAHPTLAEAALVELLTARGMPFQRERPLLGRFFVDFYFPPERTVLELIEPNRHQEAADPRRTAMLEKNGFLVLHIQADVVQADPAAVVDRLAKALLKRGVQALDASVSTPTRSSE